MSLRDIGIDAAEYNIDVISAKPKPPHKVTALPGGCQLIEPLKWAAARRYLALFQAGWTPPKKPAPETAPAQSAAPKCGRAKALKRPPPPPQSEREMA
jgi:hypothetical protein